LSAFAPPGSRAIATVKQALSFVERNVHPDLARLPRWTFARALLEEAAKMRKSRDVNAAFRQLKQALSNEKKWLDESVSSKTTPISRADV
jgi:glutathione S-transferase